jgi:isoquinoline 1-oxidoreductase beta subunit
VLHEYPVVIGFWRSVGHPMNDFFYETFFDEVADAGKQDPFELRRRLLSHSPRHRNLLDAVAALSGGWRRGPFAAEDGTQCARGVAMASPFGSEVATIAEVSHREGEIVVHDVWIAIDPGRIVNPAIIEAQVNSAVALGLSSALLEEVVYENGMPRARNFDGYPILPPDRMPRVHVRIVESGAPMGRHRRAGRARRASGGGERRRGSHRAEDPQHSLVEGGAPGSTGVKTRAVARRRSSRASAPPVFRHPL